MTIFTLNFQWWIRSFLVLFCVGVSIHLMGITLCDSFLISSESRPGHKRLPKTFFSQQQHYNSQHPRVGTRLTTGGACTTTVTRCHFQLNKNQYDSTSIPYRSSSLSPCFSSPILRSTNIFSRKGQFNEKINLVKRSLFGKTPFDPNKGNEENDGNSEGEGGGSGGGGNLSSSSRPYDSTQSIELFKKFMEGSSSLMKMSENTNFDGNFQQPSLQLISGNEYIDLITSISPNDLISRFQYTAPERVKDAVKKTTLGFVGSVSNYVVDQVYTSYGVALASLLLQCQITGYMFRNAEARLEANYGPDLRQMEGTTQRKLLPEDVKKDKKQMEADLKKVPLPPLASDNTAMYNTVNDMQPFSSAVSSSPNQEQKNQGQLNLVGNITVKDEITGELVEVDAEEYIKGLKEEANKLKRQLNQFEIEKKEKITKDLFNYLKTLPQDQLKELTANMGQDVVEAMQKLVQDVMEKVDESPIEENQEKEIGGTSLAQLVMWGLVVGYNLRDIEMTWENGLPNGSSYKNNRK